MLKKYKINISNSKLLIVIVLLIILILIGDIIYINQYEKNNFNSELNNNYSDYNNLGDNISCNLDNCKYIISYDKYNLFRQNNDYYLYNNDNGKLILGPFRFNNNELYDNILYFQNRLIGIYYINPKGYNFYNVEINKSFSVIEGNLWTDDMTEYINLLSKYNFFVIENDKGNNFINLSNGEIIFTIPNKVHKVYEDSANKILYFNCYDENSKTYTIYNNNGKVLFNKVSDFQFVDNKILVSYDNYFEIYNNKYNLIHKSREYKKIKAVYNDFAVVISNNFLSIIDMNDNILASFSEEWSEEKYVFHPVVSGWYNENNEDRIYLVIENMSIPDGTKGRGIEFYYVLKTKETKIIETEGLGGYEKPILYLYPTYKTDVVVSFENPSLIKTTYPKYNNSWHVSAYPNGDLFDKDGKYYYALYWEEVNNHYINFKTGFYVEKDDAITFLEEKLSIIGLNAKERNEFIMYWLPVLEKNEKSLVYFELTEEREFYNKLIINPLPDSLLRVAIHVKRVKKKENIKEQKLISFNRTGFAAVEWGGSNY